MCNSWCIDFSRKVLPLLSQGAKILEVGSRDVNGSVRSVLARYVERYIGVDIVMGPGVDELLDVASLSARFNPEAFDVVVNTEMLEHCFDWQNAIYEMLRVLKKDGILILTTRSPGFEHHEYPADYWRFTKLDLEHIFKGISTLLAIDDDMTLGWPCGIGIIVRKTVDNKLLDSWMETVRHIVVTAVNGPNDDNQCLEEKLLFNKYSPYRACVDIVKKIGNCDSTILDVGAGKDCYLADFLPNYQIVFADQQFSLKQKVLLNKIEENVSTHEIIGRKFDFVISIDTFEHIQPDQRDKFIERMSELASQGLIISFPSGDAGDATDTDKWVNDVYSLAYGQDYPGLREHFQNGLPSLSKTIAHLKELGWYIEVAQNGHTPWLRILLGFTACAQEHKSLNKILFEMSEYFNKELYKFDHFEPSYRQIIVATRSKLHILNQNDDSRALAEIEAAKCWASIEKRIAGSSSFCVKAIQEYEAICDNKLDVVAKQIANKDDELQEVKVRLAEEVLNSQALMSSISWKITSPFRKIINKIRMVCV